MAAETSDSSLVAQALSGERGALGLLVERHRPLAVRLAVRLLGDDGEAEDVVQDACLQALLGLDRLRDPDRFGAWLAGIALNLARMRARARKSLYGLGDWDGGRLARGFRWFEAQQPSAEAVYEVRELHAAVMRALESLPPEQQAVVRLHYLDGLTLSEIGVLAGSPLGTVKARLHRARQRLRAELRRAWPDTPAARKESSSMVEVVVENVIMRVGRPRDVIEAASRDRPAAEVPDVRIPLPPEAPPGAQFQAPHIQRVVILKEKAGERLLPIWIGPHEAEMLALQLAGADAPRPLTYDLVARLLEAAQTRIERVSISQLKEEVFYATLTIVAGGRTQAVDARPSDALNLALRAKIPIFVDAQVMDGAAVAREALDQHLEASERKYGASETAPSDDMQMEWRSVPPPDVSAPRPRPEKPDR